MIKATALTIYSLIISSAAWALELPDPAIKDNRIVALNKPQAEEYCRRQNKRLPTVRELAQWAQERGAAGIKEPSTKGGFDRTELSNMRDKGFDPVFHVERYPSMSIDFYFSRQGFKGLPSNAILAGGAIWAGDARQLNNDRQAYAFTPGNPAFTAMDERQEIAFSCVKK